jgi:hypothetical protein
MFNVGDYTFAPWKVVWPWIATELKCAITDAVPEHNVTFVSFESEEEAHYFCGSINSSPAGFIAKSSHAGGGGGIARPSVMDLIRISKYAPGDPVHRALAEASQEAHAVAAQGDTERLAEIEARVDALAAKLWGLTDRELAALRSGLGALGAREKKGGER